MIEWPPCDHRGRILAGGDRCFCRAPERPGTAATLDVCRLYPVRQTDGQPTPAAEAAPRPLPPTTADLPCVHRSADPIRTEACKTCSTLFGIRQIDVYGCSRHGECTLPQSEVFRAADPTRLTKWCQSCKDRTPAAPAPAVPIPATGSSP